MIEKNPFTHFIPKHPGLLVIGSFPCFNGSDYGNWYYSGSGRNHFWQLLSELYGLPAVSRAQKKKICEEQGIALSDIALRIERKSGNCSDSNLLILEYNKKGIQKCLDAGIKKVIFTSRFVQTHFNRLFPGCSLPQELLLSPSPAANRHIGGLEEYRKFIQQKKVTGPYAYRLLKYKETLMKEPGA